MANARIDLDAAMPKVRAPDWAELEKSRSEHDFGKASFDLVKHAATYAHLAAGLVPTAPYQRNDAILCGLLLKASKLAKAVVVMTAHLGSDRQLALVRELIEALAILKHLLEDTGDGRRFDQYVQDSLVAEREFLRTIARNVESRGTTLPIEESMARSISRTAAEAGVTDVTAVPGRSRVGWPSVEHLVEGLGPNLYPAYRVGSSVLHTRWLDLVRHHIRPQNDGRFELRFEDDPPRPEPLYASALLLVSVTRDYLARTRPEAVNMFSGPLRDLEHHVIRVAQLHSRLKDGDEPG